MLSPHFVSLIIPVCPRHNQQRFLGSCLDALSKQTFPKASFQVIVLGDGCFIQKEFAAHRLVPQIVEFSNPIGVVSLRNKGFHLAKGEYIGFLDADCVPQENWLSTLMAGFTDDRVGGCAGATLTEAGCVMYEDRILGSGYFFPVTGMGNVIFRKKALEEIHGFDEALDYGAEEVDLCWRIHLKGHAIRYQKDAKVLHGDENHNFKKNFLEGKAVYYLSKKFDKFIKISKMHELLDLFLRRVQSPRSSGGRVCIGPAFFSALAILSGFMTAMIGHCFQRKNSRVDLSDTYLEPASAIRPLKLVSWAESLCKPNYVIGWEADEGVRVVNLKQYSQYFLGKTAAFFWTSLMRGQGENAILAEALARYDVEEPMIKKDLHDFVSEMRGHGLLEPYRYGK